MILVSLLLMQATYTPEVEAVMNRSRRQAEERRADERSAVSARSAQDKASTTPVAKGVVLSPDMQKKFQTCLDTSIADPAAGVKFAQAWAVDGGSFPASQCRGFAEARAEHWEAAAGAFETAANDAQKAGSPIDAARLYVQAGNAALAGGRGEQARGYFDAALGHGLPDGVDKGELYLDRARTLVAMNDLKGARGDIDLALKQVPDDPLAWLLSATLARRQDDLSRAAKDIAEAKKRSPEDASVALEEGNIAILSGDEAVASAAWQRVLTLAPQTDQAKAAQASLDQLGGEKAGTPAATQK